MTLGLGAFSKWKNAIVVSLFALFGLVGCQSIDTRPALTGEVADIGRSYKASPGKARAYFYLGKYKTMGIFARELENNFPSEIFINDVSIGDVRLGEVVGVEVPASGFTATARPQIAFDKNVTSSPPVFIQPREGETLYFRVDYTDGTSDFARMFGAMVALGLRFSMDIIQEPNGAVVAKSKNLVTFRSLGGSSPEVASSISNNHIEKQATPSPINPTNRRPDNIESRLTTLKKLLDNGVITGEEYTRRKNEILNEL